MINNLPDAVDHLIDGNGKRIFLVEKNKNYNC